ncbi:hypothetical protein C356_05217 [Cryptococcus neoformans c45]|nr:hypothetical protein C356_05217 [Cryptococcus neoformans var. grubii c45]
MSIPPATSNSPLHAAPLINKIKARTRILRRKKPEFQYSNNISSSSTSQSISGEGRGRSEAEENLTDWTIVPRSELEVVPQLELFDNADPSLPTVLKAIDLITPRKDSVGDQDSYEKMPTAPLKIVYSSTRRTPIKSRTYDTFVTPSLVPAASNSTSNYHVPSPSVQGSIPIPNVITTPFRRPRLTLGIPESPSIILTPPDDECSSDELSSQTVKRKSHTLLLYSPSRPYSDVLLSSLERFLQVVILVLRLIGGAMDGSVSALEVTRRLVQKVVVAQRAVGVPKTTRIEYVQTPEEHLFIPGSYPCTGRAPHLATFRFSVDLADYPLILFRITDHLDPLLACRLNKLCYDRYVGLIYRCLVVKGGLVDGLLKGLARAKIEDEDEIGVRDGKKTKVKAMMTAEKISIRDAQGMRELLQVLEKWKDRHNHGQPSSNTKPLFGNVKTAHFSKQLISDIALNQASSSFNGLRSAQAIKDYWTPLIKAFFTYIGSGSRDGPNLGSVSLCFDLTDSSDIYRRHGTYDLTDTGTPCAVDMLCSAAIDSVSATKAKAMEVKLHLTFDLFVPIPIISFSRTLSLLYHLFSLSSSSSFSSVSSRIPPVSSKYHGPTFANTFIIIYDLDISGRVGPRQYIRPMWLHFCIAWNCYHLSNSGSNDGAGVIIRYVVPRRTKFHQSLETFWEDEGKGRWAEERWEVFKKCLITRTKSTRQMEMRCGCK